jgi:hypothetical protein
LIHASSFPPSKTGPAARVARQKNMQPNMSCAKIGLPGTNTNGAAVRKDQSQKRSSSDSKKESVPVSKPEKSRLGYNPIFVSAPWPTGHGAWLCHLKIVFQHRQRRHLEIKLTSGVHDLCLISVIQDTQFAVTHQKRKNRAV